MKSEMLGRYCMVLCLGVVMSLMLIQTASSLDCYSCTAVFGIGGDNCLTVTNSTPTVNCTDGCQTLISNILKSVTRGCGTKNGGCAGWGDLQVCEYSCNTTLCNTQSAALPNSSAYGSLLLLVATLVALRNFV